MYTRCNHLRIDEMKCRVCLGQIMANRGDDDEVVKLQVIAYLAALAEQATKEVALEARVGAANCR